MICFEGYGCLTAFFLMSQSEFDAIIDDCFLDGAARFISRRYEDRTNLRAAQIISEITEQEKTDLKLP